MSKVTFSVHSFPEIYLARTWRGTDFSVIALWHKRENGADFFLSFKTCTVWIPRRAGKKNGGVTCTLDSGRLILSATSSLMKMSGYLVFPNRASRTSSCALVNVVLSLRCFLGLPTEIIHENMWESYLMMGRIRRFLCDVGKVCKCWKDSVEKVVLLKSSCVGNRCFETGLVRNEEFEEIQLYGFSNSKFFKSNRTV